jgi:hypothetical protein
MLAPPPNFAGIFLPALGGRSETPVIRSVLTGSPGTCVPKVKMAGRLPHSRGCSPAAPGESEDCYALSHLHKSTRTFAYLRSSMLRGLPPKRIQVTHGRLLCLLCPRGRGGRSVRTPTSRLLTSTVQHIEHAEEDGLPGVPRQQSIHQPTAGADDRNQAVAGSCGLRFPAEALFSTEIVH